MRTPKTERPWTFLNHTADLRMEVCGIDIRGLFANAAEGLTEVLGLSGDAQAEHHLELHVESSGLEELLVDWLREILFYNQVRGCIMLACSIDEISETALSGRLSFAFRRPEDQPETEIKGVTYHGLSVEKGERGYCARILFDI